MFDGANWQNFIHSFSSLIDQFQHISLDDSSLGSSPASSTTSSGSKHSSNATAELRASISKMFQAQIDEQDVNLITEYDDEGTSRSESSSKSSAEAMAGQEPIYAVVNLKNKYARRAKKIEIDENVFVKERPNSFHVISGDYEEVKPLMDDFWANCIRFFLSTGTASRRLPGRNRRWWKYLRTGELKSHLPLFRAYWLKSFEKFSAADQYSGCSQSAVAVLLQNKHRCLGWDYALEEGASERRLPDVSIFGHPETIWASSEVTEESNEKILSSKQQWSKWCGG